MSPFVIYLLVGLVLVLIGRADVRKASRKKKRCSVPASAMIVEVQTEDDESMRTNTRKKYAYTPIFEFMADGTVVRKSGGIYSHTKRTFRVGDTAAVHYDPEQPEDFLVDGKNGGKAFGIGMMLFGLLIIGIAFTQR